MADGGEGRVGTVALSAFEEVAINACCITCDAFGAQAALRARSTATACREPGQRKGERGLKQVDRPCGKRINHSAAIPQAGAVSCEPPRRSARSAVT